MACYIKIVEADKLLAFYSSFLFVELDVETVVIGKTFAALVILTELLCSF